MKLPSRFRNEMYTFLIAEKIQLHLCIPAGTEVMARLGSRKQ